MATEKGLDTGMNDLTPLKTGIRSVPSLPIIFKMKNKIKKNEVTKFFELCN